MSLGVNQVMFAKQVLEFLGEELPIPLIIENDNCAAILMAKSQKSIGRTRHINIRFHHVQSHVDDGIIELKYVPIVTLVTNMFTKVLGPKRFTELAGQLLSDLSLSRMEKTEGIL